MSDVVCLFPHGQEKSDQVEKLAGAVLASCTRALRKEIPDWRPWTLVTPDNNKIVAVLCSPSLQTSVANLHQLVKHAVKGLDQLGVHTGIKLREKQSAAFGEVEDALKEAQLLLAVTHTTMLLHVRSGRVRCNRELVGLLRELKDRLDAAHVSLPPQLALQVHELQQRADASPRTPTGGHPPAE